MNRECVSEELKHKIDLYFTKSEVRQVTVVTLLRLSGMLEASHADTSTKNSSTLWRRWSPPALLCLREERQIKNKRKTFHGGGVSRRCRLPPHPCHMPWVAYRMALIT
ncbi:hypothetical protein L1887_23394 [Cichorium endivia]|nr:hypothetical protein L1887_23394 [Cichorium endivia]